MNLSFFIARKYLFARKSHNIINIISLISALVMAFVTTAMVIVLSAFNGIEDLVRNLYSTLDPEIRIVASQGKHFDEKLFPFHKLQKSSFIQSYSRVLEDEVLVRYQGNQLTALLKGVDGNYRSVTNMDSALYQGSPDIGGDERPRAYMGAGLHYHLLMPRPEQLISPMEILSLPKGNSLRRDRESALKSSRIPLAGTFSVNAEFDTRYIFVPLAFAREAFNLPERITAIEIKLKDLTQKKAAKKLSALVGKDFKVITREKKNEVLFKTSQTEKWVTFLILSFIVLIAAFNILASLTMLIIDKKRDLNTLFAMGLTRAKIILIFFYQSLLINAYGLLFGIVSGVLLCYLQMKFGLLQLTGSVVQYYPVQVQWQDIALISGVMSVITFLSYFGVRYLIERHTESPSV